MIVVEVIFWVSIMLVVYVYFGYPLLLWLMKKATGGNPVENAEIRPTVTLIISAFNEEAVIAEKLRNSLAIDYPWDLFEVMVVSDASDDETDAIVESCSDDRVRLLCMPERGGKTIGLNAAAEIAAGEILVFSDANAMYQEHAIQALIRNFADQAVGAVVGESTYSNSSNEAEETESLYWRYEVAIKQYESALGSVVGGDGAIYAIRKELYRPMPADALSDFVNPCQIVQLGYRCIYEPQAISVEEAAGSFQKEFKRKVRIVNRAWRAVMSMKELMNPIRYGFFTIELVSHKVLRWLVPFFLVVAFIANTILLVGGGVYQVTFALQVAFYAFALVGAQRTTIGNASALLYVPYYFCLVNIASARGIFGAYNGETYTTWSTARTEG